MSTSSSRRLLTGLAAAAVTLGMVGLPVVASADPTALPDAKATATAPPKPSEPTTSEPASPGAPAAPTSAAPTSAAATPDPSSPAPTSTASPTPSETPSDAESPAAGPSPDDASPSADQSVRTQVTGDALAVPGPTPSAAPEPELAAQAVAGASIALSKSVTPTRVSRVGEVVTYTFRATNDGSVPLTEVGITDELEGLTTTCPSTGASLAPGAVLRCTAILTVTQGILDFGDIYNFATVFGSFTVEGSPVDYVGANAAARVTVDQSPSIALRASVSPTGTADRGDRLRYTGTATNTGNVTLTAARITSSLRALDLDCEPSAGATLAPGASISCAGGYRVSAADARRGRVSTTLTARAERPFGQSSSGDDVTDAVRLRVAVTKPPATTSIDHGLADTGGPALPLGVAGLTAMAGGLVLLRRARRS